MYYVEYLRASRSLVIGAIWVAVALAINLALWRAGNVVIEDKHFVVPLTIVWAFAGFVTSIYATVLGGSLAAENEGHLPVAWTKPVSKTKGSPVPTVSTSRWTKPFVDCSSRKSSS